MAKSRNDEGNPSTSSTLPAYPDAVQLAKHFLESWMAGNGKGLAAGKNLLDSNDWQAMQNEVAGISMLRKQPGDLLAWAMADSQGWDALRLGVARAVERGDEIPPEAAKWLALFLRGKIEKPHGNPGAHSSLGKHAIIYLVVASLVQRGMNATRNDASAPTSACDAVADAMAEIGLQPATFDSVKRIWLATRKKMPPAIPAT